MSVQSNWTEETIRTKFLEMVKDIPGVLDVCVSRIEYYVLKTIVNKRDESADSVYGAEWDFMHAHPDLPVMDVQVVEKQSETNS